MGERLGGGGDNIEGIWDRLTEKQRAEHLNNWRRQLKNLERDFLAATEGRLKNIDRLQRNIEDLFTRLLRLIEGLEIEGGKEISKTEFGGMSRSQAIVAQMKALLAAMRGLQQNQSDDYESARQKMDAVRQVLDLLSTQDTQE